MYELNLCLPRVNLSYSQGLTGAIKQNYEQCLPCRLQQKITKTQQTYKVLLPDGSIHGVSFSGYTNQSEGSKLFQESRFLQSARNQEEPVEVDSDDVMSTKM